MIPSRPVRFILPPRALHQHRPLVATLRSRAAGLQQQSQQSHVSQQQKQPSPATEEADGAKYGGDSYRNTSLDKEAIAVASKVELVDSDAAGEELNNNDKTNLNDIAAHKDVSEEEQIKFHQSLLDAQRKSTMEMIHVKNTCSPGLLSPKLFSAEQLQLMQVQQVQAQMQQVYQQVDSRFYSVVGVFAETLVVCCPRLTRDDRTLVGAD